jgi:hypothetical protein
MTIKYKSKGVVLGNTWGGGRGSYPTIGIKCDDLEHLIELNKEALKDGSLDSGMGFESLIGALLNIETIRTIEVDGRLYTTTETENLLIGDLTEKQIDFLYS